ncbi:hypothetical protein QJQ45_001917 [Haematococcus lacustris]|nr:hypothetical protein QJQ45_001917 [Haematococcus lacustris]
MLRVWAHAGDAVSQLLERQQGQSPPWAVTLSQLLQDNSLMLRLSVVAVVGESFLVPELMWASKDDGLHAFEFYRHTQDVLARLGTWDTLPLLALQKGTPKGPSCIASASSRSSSLRPICRSTVVLYQATRMEVAIDVVYHAELRLPPPEDGQQQQQQEDPYGTWRHYASDIRAMAVNGDPGSPALRLHLEQYMELPALLQLMSLRTCKEAMKTVDVHDLQQRMGQLRAKVRRKEDAAVAAQRSAKAERQITEAAHKVGRVVGRTGARTRLGRSEEK